MIDVNGVPVFPIRQTVLIFRLAFPRDSHYNSKQKETDIKLRRMLYGNQEIHAREG